MSALSDARMLHEHGTKICSLPPGLIVGAAAADLRRRAEVEGTTGLGVRYAFLARHVRKANGDLAKLIQAALDEIELGRASSKINTLRLYAEEEALRSALEMAKASQGPEARNA